jgi:tripartite-type tricarboxylate transporter receptor subunit TctC
MSEPLGERTYMIGPSPFSYIRALLVGLLGLAAATSGARAAFPERPITLKLGFSAGGSSDISARTFLHFFEKYLPAGSKVVIEYKPGADGIVMYRELAAARPDGYNLGLIVSPNAIAVLHEGKNPHYGLESYDYLGQLMADYATLTVAKDSRFKNLNQMIDWARANPRKLTIGVAGLSGINIQIREMFLKAGAEVTFVPFKGGGDLSSALLGGHIDASGVNLTSATTYKDVQRIVAVFSEKRLEGLEDIPTVRETGIDVVAVTNRGIVAPRGLPNDIRNTLVAAVAKAAQDPEYHAVLRKDSLVPAYLALSDYERYMQSVYDLYGAIWKRSSWIDKE